MDIDGFNQLFTEDLLPHGYCIAWQPGLLWLHFLSDALIALAYYSIPIALAYFVGARKDLAYKWMFNLFGLFIFSCGTTHLISVFVIWEPLYWIDGGAKAVTAGVSLATAVALWPLIPKALALPSPAQYRLANEALSDQFAKTQQAQQSLREANNRLEERVQERTAALERLNEELRSFTYIVSHDLRAPLVNLKGFSGELRYVMETLKEVLADTLDRFDKKQQDVLNTAIEQDIPEALDFIDAAVSRMDSLTNAILKLSRLGRREFDLERLDMNHLLLETVQSFAHQIEQQQVEVKVGDLPEIIADRTSMEQIMSNLLSNAINYLDPDRPGKINIRAESSATEVTFHIQDNGRGIAAYDMPKIFEIFRRVGPQTVPGEGMGLTYVQMLVRRHGGQIWCRSEEGAGAIFSIKIPKQL